MVVTYTAVMVTVVTFMVVVLLVIIVRHTAQFLVKRAKDAQAQEYSELRSALYASESPLELEFFTLKYPQSIYREHAMFEIGEKYYRGRRFHLAREAYQKFLGDYPDSFHCEVIRARLDQIDKILG